MTIDNVSRKLTTALTLTAMILLANIAVAEESTSGHDSGHHKNIVGVFGGITHGGRRLNAAALGLEYERRIGDSFGIGAVAEYTFGDADVWIFAIPFSYHTGRLKLYVAPGIEDGHHGKEDLVRLGAEYAFPKQYFVSNLSF